MNTNIPPIPRDRYLLKAAYDLLNQQRRSRITLCLLEETVFYDDAECDGACLMDDIASELGLEDRKL